MKKKENWREECGWQGEGGKLVTDAHESKPRSFCFEIVPAPPVWPFNTKLLFHRGTWPLLYTHPFPHRCPEHLGATLTELAQMGRSQGLVSWKVGVGTPGRGRRHSDTEGSPGWARAVFVPETSCPCIWRTSHVSLPPGSFGILTSLFGCKNRLLQTCPFPQIQGVSDHELLRSESVSFKMGLKGESLQELPSDNMLPQQGDVG